MRTILFFILITVSTLVGCTGNPVTEQEWISDCGCFGQTSVCNVYTCPSDATSTEDCMKTDNGYKLHCNDATMCSVTEDGVPQCCNDSGCTQADHYAPLPTSVENPS